MKATKYPELLPACRCSCRILPEKTIASSEDFFNRLISNPNNSAVSNFQAAAACNTTLTADQLRGLPDGYDARTGLPSRDQLKAVSTGSGNGAWVAAGWSNTSSHWTGEVTGVSNLAYTVDGGGGEMLDLVNDTHPVVCLR